MFRRWVSVYIYAIYCKCADGILVVGSCKNNYRGRMHGRKEIECVSICNWISRKIRSGCGLSLNQATASSTLPGIMVSVHCGRRRVIMECNKRAAGTSSSIMIAFSLFIC